MNTLPPELRLLAEKLAETYVEAKHAKEQWHFENPEKRGPLPHVLEEQGYMFKAGFLACYQVLWADANASKELSMIDFNKRVDAEERIGELETMLAQGRQLLEADNKRIKELEAAHAYMNNIDKTNILLREEIKRLREALVTLIDAVKSDCMEDEHGKTGAGWAFTQDIEKAREALAGKGEV